YPAKCGIELAEIHKQSAYSTAKVGHNVHAAGPHFLYNPRVCAPRALPTGEAEERAASNEILPVAFLTPTRCRELLKLRGVGGHQLRRLPRGLLAQPLPALIRQRVAAIALR